MNSFIVKKIKRTLAVVVMFALLCNTTAIPSIAAGERAAGDKSVTVTVSGNGEATLNVVSGGDLGSISGGDGATLTKTVSNGDVEITLTPDTTGDTLERNYIKDLTCDGNSVINQVTDRYSAYTMSMQNIVEDKLIHVAFGTEYGISAGTITNPEGGSVSFSKEWVDGDATDKNVMVAVTANEGYRVETVFVGDSRYDAQLAKEWSQTVEITKGTLVDVAFVPVYTVKVNFDVTKGQTTISGGDAVSGEVYTYRTEDGSVEFVADPAENYRVSEVMINNQKQQWSGQGKNGEESKYSTILEPSDDYEIEVTFALDRYTIHMDALENMSIYLKGNYNDKIASYECDYGSEPVFVIVPDDGYHVSSIEYGATADTLVSCDDLAAYGVVEGAQGVEFKAPTVEQDYMLRIETEKNATTVDNLVVNDGVIGKSQLSGNYYTLKFTDEQGIDAVIQHWGTKDGIPYIVLPKNSRVKITANEVNGVAFSHLRINEENAYSTELVKEGTFLLDSVDISTSEWGHGTTGLSDVLEVNSNVILMMDDGSEPEAELTANEADQNGCYSGDITVTVHATDITTGTHSGIQSVTYWVKADGAYTQGVSSEDAEQGSLYQHKDGAALCTQWDGTFVVDAEKNNSSEVEAGIIVKDSAGNTITKSLQFDIDITAPTIEISYDNNEVIRADANGQTYFNAIRNAKVVITERTNHFEADKVDIVITAKDAEGNEVTGYAVSDWVTTKGNTPDEDTHTAIITYASDANYTFAITYADKVGNQNVSAEGKQIVTVKDSRAPFKFTVDTQAPSGTITAVVPGHSGITWEALNEMLSFGYWTSAQFDITATQSDATSPIYSVQYYKVSGRAAETLLSKEDLERLPNSAWVAFEDMSVTANEQFVIYLKITDYAGNYSYVGSQGMIADNTRPGAEANAPVVSVTGGTGGVHGANVSVSVNAVDPEVNQTFSGLKSVTYQVLSGNTVTQSGSLFGFGNSNPSRDELVQSFSGSVMIDATLNNSNDVSVVVTAEDNAGNIATAKTDNIVIDITAPSINISYDNNEFQNEKYYQAGRVATIAITERNFSESDAVVTVTSANGNTAALSGWSRAGEGDGTIYTATVTFQEDDDYTLAVAFKDMAGNVASAVNYSNGTTNPESFIVDTSLPVIDVEYDNNDANEKYFAAERTATITITEHNFDEGLVEITRSASKDGKLIDNPVVLWKHQGDVHIATIAYEEDGDYTFDITMQDLAGNLNSEVRYGNSIAANDFTIDTAIEAPVIKGVENGKSYKGDVIPYISFEDINFESYEVTLLRSRKDEIDVDVTEKFFNRIETDGHGGEASFDTFEAIQDNDGVYTLMVTIRDKAGNEVSSETVRFSVNRFGSVYIFDDYLISLKDAYTQRITEKIIITEFNPDELIEGSTKVLITKDGTPLENVVFTIDRVSNGETGWYQYEYVIDESNFEEDGIYRLSISSEDKAGNKPETTNAEDGDILFRVDTVAAEITSVIGLEESIVNAETREVKFEVFDAIGLKMVQVYVNGQLVETFNEFENFISFSGGLTLTEGVNQTVRIVVEDLAGNITDTESENFNPAYIFNDSITVSTNAFIRFYANKSLFFGTIGGTVTAIVAAIGFVVLRKKRKEK